MNVSTMATQTVEMVTQASGVPFVYVITIFVLAIFVGYYVVWGVTPALHTPLMAVTNALSGVVIVGAMLQTVATLSSDTVSSLQSAGTLAQAFDPSTYESLGLTKDNYTAITATSVLGAIAVFLASINIFGGFAVTSRMLEMFKSKKKN